MGKRSAAVELFLGDMGSIQRELRPSTQREDQLTMETKLEQIAVKAVNQLPKSVVREIRTPRSVGAGGGRPPPATRWARGNSRPYREQDRHTVRMTRLTQCMVRPCVARGFVNLADAVLHQCIRPLIGACCAPGHHGYQRAFELISGPASNGPFGSPVFACAGKPDLHRRLILSQTSAGKGCWLRHL